MQFQIHFDTVILDLQIIHIKSNSGETVAHVRTLSMCKQGAGADRARCIHPWSPVPFAFIVSGRHRWPKGAAVVSSDITFLL